MPAVMQGLETVKLTPAWSDLLILCAAWSFLVKPAQSESGQENYTSLNGLLHLTKIRVIKKVFRDSYSWSHIILRKNVFLIFPGFTLSVNMRSWTTLWLTFSCSYNNFCLWHFPCLIRSFTEDFGVGHLLTGHCLWQALSGAIGPRHLNAYNT